MPFNLEKVLKSEATTLIFSIGSAGGDKQQTCPNFAVDLSASEKIDIMNFDSGFKAEQKINMNENLVVYFYQERVEGELEKQLGRCIETAMQANKKIIVMDHIGVSLTPFTIDMLQLYADKVGTQIEFMGGYTLDIPIFKYKGQFFKNKSFKEVNKQLGKAWVWCERLDTSLGNEPFNVFSTKELQGWRDQHSNIGILYRNLASVRAQELFSNKSPSPIIGIDNEKFEKNKNEEIENIKNGNLEPFEKIEELLKKRAMGIVIDCIKQNPKLLGLKKHGRTLAHLAVTHNPLDNPELVHFLGKEKVDLTTLDQFGYPPLAFTAWNAGPKTTEALIQQGAHKNLTHNQMTIIIENAKESGRFDTAKVLEDAIQIQQKTDNKEKKEKVETHHYQLKRQQGQEKPERKERSDEQTMKSK